MPGPERILLVRLSHLGDVVHALPVFHALRAGFPGARIAWAVQPEFASLLRGLPGLDRLVLFERHRGWRAWRALRAELFGFGADLCVDAQGNLKSAAAAVCSRAPRRLGLDRADWREPLGAWTLTERAAPARAAGPEPVHALERMLALARHVALCANLAHWQARFDPDLSRAELQLGARACAERLPRAGGAPFILQLADPRDVRSWPPDHYRALARMLLERGQAVLLLSGPQEEHVGARLERELGRGSSLAHWVGQCGLRELAGFFQAAALRGARLLCCDSGPLHLACSVGLPVLQLAGPQDARRTGPWPLAGAGAHRSLRSFEPLACAPCLSRLCRHPEGPVCLSRLAPQTVARALLDGCEAQG